MAGLGSKPHLVVRADGNSVIGVGHLMRCFSLAQAWKDGGGFVTFMTACSSDNLLDRLYSEGFRVVRMLEPSLDAEEWAKTGSILRGERDAWVVVDGYHFGVSHHKKIREQGNPLLVIDDMRHLESYYVDLILNQNFNAESLAYPCGKYTHLLLGTRYVLLRREFRQLEKRNREIPRRCRSILVSMGGADPYNLTLKILNALDVIEGKISINIILGPTNPNWQSVLDFAQVSHRNITVIEAPDKMAELMCQADLAVTTGGSTTWELCYLGVPSLQIIVAKNQEAIACELADKGVTVNLGWHDAVTETDIAVAAQKLIADADKRRSMSVRGQSIVDGKGAERVVSTMRSFKRQRRDMGQAL